MDVIYGLIPGMIILGLVGVVVFFWAARSGQFEDLEGEANRILMDEDLPPRKVPTEESNTAEENNAENSVQSVNTEKD
jgi:cbb3-type cytochrome oxidase maturation protein